MYQHKTPVRELARGKWHGILSDLGIHQRFLTGKSMDCPICSDGHDRFRWDNKDGYGTYFCSQCNSGDGIMLAQKFTGMDFASVAKHIEKISGTLTVQKSKTTISSKNSTDLIKKVWNEAKPIERGDEAYQYLKGRGLALSSMPKSMKFHSGLEYRDDNDSLGIFPALISLVASPQGKMLTLHRTYILNGQKAPVPKPKKMMPVSDDVTINGGAIRLFESGEVLGLTEGIETALAASEIFNIPVWSCISANGIEKFEIPDRCNLTKIIIFGDNDASYTGHKAAYMLANRLVIKNKDLVVEVKIPPVTGDWLDYLVSLKNLPN